MIGYILMGKIIMLWKKKMGIIIWLRCIILQIRLVLAIVILHRLGIRIRIILGVSYMEIFLVIGILNINMMEDSNKLIWSSIELSAISINKMLIIDFNRKLTNLDKILIIGLNKKLTNIGSKSISTDMNLLIIYIGRK